MQDINFVFTFVNRKEIGLLRPKFSYVMEIKDRIRKLMDSQHMSRQVFCDYVGLSQATLSNIFNGKSRPTLMQIDAIKRKFPAVNTDWLLYGSGQMYNDGQQTNTETTGVPQDDVASQVPDVAPTLFSELQEQQNVQRVNNTPKNVENLNVKIIDKPIRQITEIRIFYNDQTWETFVPKK